MCMKKRYFARLSITVIVMVAMVFPVFSFAETGDIPQDEKVTSTIPYVYEEPDDITILDESKLIPEDSTSSNVTTPSRVPATAIWKCESKKELDERLVSLFIMVILVVQEEHCPRKLPIALQQRFLGILK